MFDTHCHYNLEPIWSDWKNAAAKAKSAGITGTVVVGTDSSTNDKALYLRQRLPDFFFAALGLHPESLSPSHSQKSRTSHATLPADNTSNPTPQLKKLSSLIHHHRSDIAAIGEIGLDFYHLSPDDPHLSVHRQKQLSLFTAQLTLAVKFSLPIILHVRDHDCDLTSPTNAYALVLHTLAASPAATLPLIFHCFSGTQNYLQQALAFPHSYISFAGNLTFKTAGNLRHLITLVPPHRLLLETDAPFLSPAPKRGQVCQPHFFTHTAALAASLGIDLAQVQKNSHQIFTKNTL